MCDEGNTKDSSIGKSSAGTDSEVVAFLQGRSVPCPRCGYDLCDIKSAKCPECAEPLVLKIGSPRARFGWLVLAMAPGCFSGVAAVFVLLPIYMNVWREGRTENGVWLLVGADLFGFVSAAMVAVMYKHRHRIMAWSARQQGAFAASVWGIHVAALGIVILSAWLMQ